MADTKDKGPKGPNLSAKKVDLIARIKTFLAANIPADKATSCIDAMHNGRRAQIESYRLFIAAYSGLCAEFHLRTNAASWTEYMTPYLQEITGKTKGFSYPSMIAYKANIFLTLKECPSAHLILCLIRRFNVLTHSAGAWIYGV